MASTLERQEIEQRLYEARMHIQLTWGYFAPLLYRIRFVVLDPVEAWQREVLTTTITPRLELLMNADFVVSRTVPDLIVILYHEMAHVWRMTWQRQANRDPLLWNLAMDLEINEHMWNEVLTTERVARVSRTVLEGLVTPVNFNIRPGRTAEAYYEDLTGCEWQTT